MDLTLLREQAMNTEDAGQWVHEGVLVVDDDADVRETMIAILEEAGLCVLGAGDGEAALGTLGGLACSVVVSDIIMPGLDGIELLDAVKRRLPWTEVLLVTGYGSPDLARRAWQRGACGFIEKPFHAEHLVAAVRQALWRAHLQRQRATGTPS